MRLLKYIQLSHIRPWKQAIIFLVCNIVVFGGTLISLVTRTYVFGLICWLAVFFILLLLELFVRIQKKSRFLSQQLAVHRQRIHYMGEFLAQYLTVLQMLEIKIQDIPKQLEIVICKMDIVVKKSQDNAVVWQKQLQCAIEALITNAKEQGNKEAENQRQLHHALACNKIEMIQQIESLRSQLQTINNFQPELREQNEWIKEIKEKLYALYDIKMEQGKQREEMKQIQSQLEVQRGKVSEIQEVLDGMYRAQECNLNTVEEVLRQCICSSNKP